MSSAPSRLPAGAIVAAYFAAGVCLYTSALQMHEVFASHSVAAGSGQRAILLCAAILIGGAVSWRLLGHLYSRHASARSFGAALALVFIACIYTEAMSIATSAMSLTTGVNARLIADANNAPGAQANERVQAAAASAVEQLASDLENMPANYYTRGQRTADSMAQILTQQTRLAEVQAVASTANSATARTLEQVGNKFGWSADQVAARWSLGIALALSLIPLATQLALGTLSDQNMMDREADAEAFAMPGK
jgi:hypothetical protein